MLKISKMKSLLTLSPSLFKPPGATTSPFPLCFHSQRSIFHCKIQPLKNPISLPTHFVVNSLANYSKPSNFSQSRDFCSEGRAPGEIHVIVGPMFAGKTTTLLKRMKSESSNGRIYAIEFLSQDKITWFEESCEHVFAESTCLGKNVAIIKSNTDTRYELDSIVTHDGEKLPCLPLAVLSSLREKLGAEAYEKLEVIGIDEAQFFEDLYDFCSKAADHDGKTVIVAGLDGDYLRRSFGQVLDIIPIADSVTKLTARCEVCGKRAVFTLRKTDETKTKLIAGAEVYMPVCRKHYVSGQVAKEATRAVLESQNAQFTSVI